jgi:hypothetical protein
MGLGRYRVSFSRIIAWLLMANIDYIFMSKGNPRLRLSTAIEFARGTLDAPFSG